MKLLYIGTNSGTSQDRINALGRLGIKVTVIDPFLYTSTPTLLAKWTFKTGGLFLEEYIKNKVIQQSNQGQFDVALIDNGTLLGPTAIKLLKNKIKHVVHYTLDDPFGGRDGHRFRLYIKAIPVYDLNVFVRTENVHEANKLGSKKSLFLIRSADEVQDHPRTLTKTDHLQWDSDITFIGTWMEDRHEFFEKLKLGGLSPAIYGDRWHRAPNWNRIKSLWKGPAIEGDSYAKAIQCSKICIGLLSKGNRDLHTHRSLEIPSLGGVLCAPRTSEHSALYNEGSEALFWDDHEECIETCKRLLSDPTRLRTIGENARKRALLNGHFNERLLQTIISKL